MLAYGASTISNDTAIGCDNLSDYVARTAILFVEFIQRGTALVLLCDYSFVRIAYFF